MALKIPEAKLWRGDEGAAVTGARLPAAQGRPGSRVERPCSPQLLLLWCSVPSPASHCCCFRPCSHLPLPWSLPQLPVSFPPCSLLCFSSPAMQCGERWLRLQTLRRTPLPSGWLHHFSWTCVCFSHPITCFILHLLQPHLLSDFQNTLFTAASPVHYIRTLV